MYCMLAKSFAAAVYLWTPAEACPIGCAVLPEAGWNKEMDVHGLPFPDGSFWMFRMKPMTLKDGRVCLRAEPAADERPVS